jgi:hypothetical protein
VSEKITEWDMPLSSHETEDLKDLLTLLTDLKKKGLTGVWWRCLSVGA